MTSDSNAREKSKDSPRRVFLPEARVLAKSELGSLSDREKAFARECREKGVWLELFCPDDSCFVEGDRLKLPVFCEHEEHDHSLWMELFCPGGSCEVTEATNLP